MSLKKNILLAAMGLIMAGASVTAASAETPWQQSHQRRVEVNERLKVQAVRIHRERRAGEITAYQAARLHHADHRILVQERWFARRHGGHLTRAEQIRLNHAENRTSRHIGA